MTVDVEDVKKILLVDWNILILASYVLIDEEKLSDDSKKKLKEVRDALKAACKIAKALKGVKNLNANQIDEMKKAWNKVLVAWGNFQDSRNNE